MDQGAQRLEQLIRESFEFDAAARPIQSHEPSLVSDEDIEQLRQRYQDWYAASLPILPEDLGLSFRKQYDNGLFSQGVKKFLDDPRKRNVLYQKETNDPSNPFSPTFFQFPVERYFTRPVNEQRFVLQQARQRLLLARTNDSSVLAAGGRAGEGSGEPAVFIAHGRSPLYLKVKDHLRDRLDLDIEFFEGHTRTARQIIQVLEQLLNRPAIAIVVLTGEDRTEQGRLRARQNVVHELGLFQGRLGFENVAVLVQDGAELFSNIDGLQHIRFHEERVQETFPELERWLEDRNLLAPRPGRRAAS